MELYREINIPNLLDIQKELFKEIQHVVVNKSHVFFGAPISVDDMNKFPLLVDYLSSISKFPLHQYQPLKFFISSGGFSQTVHADYHRTSRVALNIPVFGCDGTYLNYYETTEENTKLYDVQNNTINMSYSYQPINNKDLKQIAHLEFNKPHLVRTDIFHSSENRTNHYRVVATVRWHAPRELYNFDDFVVMDL